MLRHLIGFAFFCATAAAPAFAEEDKAPEGVDWTLSGSAGWTHVDADGEQPFFRLGLTRTIGQGYVRGSVTYFDKTEAPGLLDTVPASTLQVSLAGGRSFGDVQVDGYASYGWRKFDPEAFRQRTGQMIEIDSDGTIAGAGLSLTYNATLGENLYLAPFVAGDINRIDIARAINVVGRGIISQKEKQTGETFSGGFTLDKGVGQRGSSIGVYAAFVTTTNSAVAIRSSAPVAAARLFGPQDVPGSNDSWVEYGGNATVALSEHFLLDFSAVRTAGFIGEDMTSFSGGARVRF